MISETLSPIAPVPAPEWTAQNKEAGRVDALLPQGPRCFVGGNMSQPKKFLFAARNDGSVGSFYPSGVVGRVYDLAYSDYQKILVVAGVGGIATHAGSTWLTLREGRYRAAGFGPQDRNLYLGAENGQVEQVGGWKVPTLGSARDLVVTNDYIYVANAGSSIGAITKLDALTGVQQPWASSPRYPVLDLALSPDGETLYAAIGGPGGTAAAYDVHTGERKWFHMTDGNCQAITCLQDGTVVVGMHGDYVATQVNKTIKESGSGGRVPRSKVFALDPDGNLLDWQVRLTSTLSPLGVWALASSPTMLYVGGDFTKVNGVEHPRTAAFEITPVTT